MGLVIANVRAQRSEGATANVTTETLAVDFTAHALHLQHYMLKESTAASSLLVLMQKLTQFRLHTVGGQPESTIDGQDWHDFTPAGLGYSPYKTVLTAVDNDPHCITIPYPLSPFHTDPTEPFGLAPGRGTQAEFSWAADTDNAFDGGTYDLTIEGVTKDIKPAPKGYLRFNRDAQTGVVGNAIRTRIQGLRLMGIFNFMTTSFDDLAAAAAIDVTTIRTQSINFSSAVRLGPMRPQRTGSMQFLPQITATPPILLDNGSHFQNFGIMNREGELGININTPELVELETIAGAADAYRTYPCTLI